LIWLSRRTTSPYVVINDQLAATVGAIKHIRAKVSLIAADGAGAEAFELLDMLGYQIDGKTTASGARLLDSRSTCIHCKYISCAYI